MRFCHWISHSEALIGSRLGEFNVKIQRIQLSSALNPGWARLVGTATWTWLLSCALLWWELHCYGWRITVVKGMPEREGHAQGSAQLWFLFVRFNEDLGWPSNYLVEPVSSHRFSSPVQQSMLAPFSCSLHRVGSIELAPFSCWLVATANKQLLCQPDPQRLTLAVLVLKVRLLLLRVELGIGHGV